MSIECLTAFGSQPPLPVKVGDIVEYPLHVGSGYHRVIGVEGGKVYLTHIGVRSGSVLSSVTQEGSVQPVTREALLRRAAELVEIANAPYPVETT